MMYKNILLVSDAIFESVKNIFPETKLQNFNPIAAIENPEIKQKYNRKDTGA